ncbi:MAG: hypothetical protein WCB49_08665 [Gammaproteobacteria bacterium]
MLEDPSMTGRHPARYPAERTSPWFFIVLVSATVAFILAGIFAFEPITRFLRWLAVVL